MAFQQSDLDTIREAMASGIMRVRFADGREVYYQSLTALIEAEKRISGILAQSTNGPNGNIRLPGYRNGF